LERQAKVASKLQLLRDAVLAEQDAELGGLRALNFYHRRAAIQGSTAVLAELK
jgi:hypothetical protein